MDKGMELGALKHVRCKNGLGNYNCFGGIYYIYLVTNKGSDKVEMQMVKAVDGESGDLLVGTDNS